MNKKYKKIVNLLIILSFTVSYTALPLDTNAKTIKEFEDEVSKYTADLKEKQDKIAKNDEEVAQIKKKISDLEKQMLTTEAEIKNLQEEIEKSNKEIEKKSEESKKIIEYYQVANGNNAYLEYAFGATDITDLVYRMSVVEQLTEYNNKIMKELEQLIKDNNVKQEQLKVKKEELKKLQENLQSEKERIDADSAAIRETMPSVETQIKEAQSNINYFKKLGCGATEDIYACQYRVSQNSSTGSLPSVGTFARPMASGYVVRGFVGKYGHMGYDLSDRNNKSIAVYPIAEGSVHAIYTDACTTSTFCQNIGYSCNGNAKIVVIKHNYNGGYIYSSYVHLGSYGNISEGRRVTKDTIIGYMGNTGCSSGPHLHLEIASCHWKNNGGCVYSGYWSGGKYINGYIDKLIAPSSLVTFPSSPSSWSNR